MHPCVAGDFPAPYWHRSSSSVALWLADAQLAYRTILEVNHLVVPAMFGLCVISVYIRLCLVFLGILINLSYRLVTSLLITWLLRFVPV